MPKQIQESNSDGYISFPIVGFIYKDAEELAKKSAEGEKTDKIGDTKRRGLFARASIQLFDSTVEAALNHLISHVAFNKLSESLRKRIERLPYKVKVKETLSQSLGVKKYAEFSRTTSWKKLIELRELRNSFIHPNAVSYPASFLNKRKGGSVKMELLGENKKYPHSKLHFYPLLIDDGDAQIASDIIFEFFQWLEESLSEESFSTFFRCSIGFQGLTQKEEGTLFPGIGKELTLEIRGKGALLAEFVMFGKNAERAFKKRRE